MPPERFDPLSHNAMFATILQRMNDATEAEEKFRTAVLARFDQGTTRMDKQDTMLDEIREQTLKTNGRVTKLEGKWKQVTAKIAGALLVLGALWQAAAWLYDHGFRVTH